jgi:hypothetical protein
LSADLQLLLRNSWFQFVVPQSCRLSGNLLATMFCLAIACAAHAEGLHYRFAGTVTDVPSDASGLALNQGYYPSQPFNFTLLVDPEAAGLALGIGGELEPVTGWQDPQWPGFYENAFFVEFVEGDRLRLPSVDEESRANYGGSTTPIETFYPDPSDPTTAFTVTNPPLGLLIVAGGAVDDLSQHWFLSTEQESGTLIDADPRNWQVGDQLIVMNSLRIGSDFAEIRAAVTLQEIIPVPEPSLAALSLIVTVAIARARRNRAEGPPAEWSDSRNVGAVRRTAAFTPLPHPQLEAR